MSNLRFATIIHILVLVYKYRAEYESCNKVISSDYIASSINVNPVVVRREVKVLKEQGILGVRKGKEGGFYLLKDASEILLGDIYQLIHLDCTIGKLNKTNPDCEIGKKMNEQLNRMFTVVESQIIAQLNQISLKEFSNQF